MLKNQQSEIIALSSWDKFAENKKRSTVKMTQSFDKHYHDTSQRVKHFLPGKQTETIMNVK